MSDRPQLAIDGLTGGYGDIVVLSGFTATVDPGSTACVAGRNGVGKTTLLRLVTGALAPVAGRVRLGDAEITHAPRHRRLRLGMGYAPQENVVFDDLTVLENLTLAAADRSLDRYDELLDAFPRIGERLSQRAGTLSGGEKKILSFCRALAEATELVVLDEPSEGVQPENIALMTGIIEAEKAKGRSFLIVEQNLGLIEVVADAVHLLDHGECIYSAPAGADVRGELSRRMRL